MYVFCRSMFTATKLDIYRKFKSVALFFSSKFVFYFIYVLFFFFFFTRMANGHVEIHDPFANNNVASSNTDPTSQTASIDDTVEFRLLMVYAQRRRPTMVPEIDGPGQTDPPLQTTENDKEEKKKKKKKKRKGAKGMLRMFNCIKPSVKSEELSEPASDAPEPEFRCGAIETGEFSCFR